MGFSRLFGTVALVGLAAAAGAACTITTGPYQGGDLGASGGSGGGQTTTPACNECLFQACGGAWAVCQQSSECSAIYQCAVQPSCVGDGQCVRGCFDAHPGGQRAYTALYTCDEAYACGG